MVQDSIKVSMERIDSENENMRTWEENMVRRSGYHVDGKSIHRDAVVDSSLGHTYYEDQSVHYYEDFYNAGPTISVSLSKTMLEGLNSSAIMLLVEQANYDIENWSKKIFGNTEKDEDGNVVLKQIALVRDSFYNDDVDRFKTLSKKDYDKLSEDEQKEFNDLSTGIVSVRDGALGEWIGYAPVFKDGNSGLDLSNNRESNIKYQGSGQMGQIMLDFQWNNMIEQQGWQKVALPAYDQPLWRGDDGWFEPPTIRGISSIVFEVVGTASGQTWFSYADDVIFAAIDLGGGFKSAEQVGLDLAKTAATAVISMGCSAAGSAIGNAAGKAMEGAGKFANFAAQAGISAATSYATSVGTSFVNNWNLDADGKLAFDAESFGKSTYSAQTIAGSVGAGVTAGLGELNLKDANNKALNSNTFKTSEIKAMNNLAGGLVQNGVSLAMGGDATFNILDFADIAGMFGKEYKNGKTGAKASTGLFEVSFGKNGFKSRFGMGGTNISYSSLNTVLKGIKESEKVTQKSFGSLEDKSILNAINDLGYTNSAHNQKMAKDLWTEELGVEFSDTGDDYGNYTLGDDKIRLSKELLVSGREGSARLAAVMSHEGTHAYGECREAIAYINGADTYSQINEMFGLTSDSSFSDQMLAGILDRDNWKENEGVVDHWRIVYKNDGSIGWEWDKDFNFNFEDGSSLTPGEMKEYIQQIKQKREMEKNGTKYYSDPNATSTHAESVITGALKDYIKNNLKNPSAINLDKVENFIFGTESFADASGAAEILKQEISNGKSSNISQYTKKMGAALLNAQESGLLSKNPYGVIDTSNLIGEGNVIHPYFSLAGIVEGSSNPYINISSYEAWRINDVDMASISTGSYILNEFSPFYHQGWDGNGNGNIVASLDGGLYLDYLNAEGFQVNNTTSLGTFGTSHASSSTVDQFFKLFGQEGVSLLHNDNHYELSGIKAGTVIGFVGNTGNNTTGTHAHMSLNGSGDQFAKVFNTSYYEKYLNPTDYAIYMSGYKNPTFDNNQLLWANVKEYANREPNKLHYNDFLNHNRDVYWNSIFWTKYPGVNK